jgi:hypothetical protein
LQSRKNAKEETNESLTEPRRHEDTKKGFCFHASPEAGLVSGKNAKEKKIELSPHKGTVIRINTTNSWTRNNIH